MVMRTDAEELSTPALNSASALLTDNNLQDHYDQRDDNVETASKKSDSGIYMDSNGENQSWSAQQVHNQYRDAQPGHVEHGPSDYHDETASYMEDNASVLSNNTTISSLIDDEDEGKQILNIETTNPSRLFWVPAEQHPEIAPAEFANWLQTHGVIRAKGQLRLRRKRSVLSISYLPGEEDEKDDSKGQQPRRRRSYDSATQPTKSQPRISTISESPIIEEEEESTSTTITPNDVVRRTVSLNILPTIGRQSSSSSQTHIFDRNSSSRDESLVLVPRTEGSLLRRSARTKIRPSSLAGSRSGSPGRRASRRSQSAHIKPSDYPERFGVVPPGGVTLQDRPVSISELIDFGGADYEPAESQQGIITRVHDAENEVFSRLAAEESQQGKAPEPEISNAIFPSHPPVVEATNVITPSQAHVNIPSPEYKENHVSFDSNEPKQPSTSEKEVAVLQPPNYVSSKIEKSLANVFKAEKRSSWSFKFLSDDKAKKKQQQQQPNALQRVESVSTVSSSVSAASDATQLSTSSVKNKLKEANDNLINPAKKFGFSTLFQRTSSKFQKSNANGGPASVKKSAKSTDVKVVNDDYSRFPMHIERAIYRLSHYKLSNPRRPLHHQVLISNLMFWYLSVINGQKIRPNNSSNHANTNVSPTPVPQSFIGHTQNNYQEEQEAAPAKLSKVGKFINASKKRRQDIMVKKQMQQQQHHQPRWLPSISETSNDSAEVKSNATPVAGHVTFGEVPVARHGHRDEEHMPQEPKQSITNQDPPPQSNKRPGGDKYSPVPNDQYQPSTARSTPTPATVSSAAATPAPKENSHPLPPIPGPPLLTEISSSDSLSDDILNSLGWEGRQSAEDDDVPLALYRNLH